MTIKPGIAKLVSIPAARRPETPSTVATDSDPEVVPEGEKDKQEVGRRVVTMGDLRVLGEEEMRRWENMGFFGRAIDKLKNALRP